MDGDEEMDQSPTVESRTRKIVNSLQEETRRYAGQFDADLYAPPGSIHKVRSFLLKGNIGIDIITPKLVSIGPYHRVITRNPKENDDGAASLKEMEGAKFKYLRDLSQRAPSINYPGNYIEIIEQLARRAMDEFSYLSQVDHEDFVKMMVVDGCFIVEFLLKWFLNDRKSQVSSIMTKLAVFKNDLLLVENQIPFFILEELFKVSSIPGLDKSAVSFTEIALAFFMGDRKAAQFTAEKFSKENAQFDHLLHLYHATLNSYSGRNYLSAVNKVGWFFIYPLVLLCSLIILIIKALLFLLLWILTKLFIRRHKPRWMPSGVPNARDLRDAGFRFHKKYEMDYNFMDISRRGRNIKIPVLHVNESLLTNFQNLIAFENCSSVYGKNFTAYAMLLDYLIDSAEDVAILKACGIIDNRLGDDQKVADFFNNLCSGFDLGDEKHYLSPLFEYVSNYYRESHYKVKFYWWRKKYVPDYFTNPWAIPSMIAASILLALTFVQTFYTVYPYYHPRSNG